MYLRVKVFQSFSCTLHRQSFVDSLYRMKNSFFKPYPVFHCFFFLLSFVRIHCIYRDFIGWKHRFIKHTNPLGTKRQWNTVYRLYKTKNKQEKAYTTDRFANLVRIRRVNMDKIFMVHLYPTINYKWQNTILSDII